MSATRAGLKIPSPSGGKGSIPFSGTNLERRPPGHFNFTSPSRLKCYVYALLVLAAPQAEAGLTLRGVPLLTELHSGTAPPPSAAIDRRLDEQLEADRRTLHAQMALRLGSAAFDLLASHKALQHNPRAVEASPLGSLKAVALGKLITIPLHWWGSWHLIKTDRKRASWILTAACVGFEVALGAHALNVASHGP